MSEKHTGPDLGESSLPNPSENSLNSEAIKKLENLGVERKTAVKLAELRGDIGDNEIRDTLQESNTQEEIQKNFSEVRQVLDEHKQKISEKIAAKAMSERIKLGESIASNIEELSDKNSSHFSNSVIQSFKTIGTFGKDFGIGFVEAVKSPKLAMQYTYAKADGILDKSDLEYTV